MAGKPRNTFLLGPPSYQRPAMTINISILVINAAALTLDIALRNPIAILPAIFVIWYAARVHYQNTLRRQEKQLRLRADLRYDTARLEREIFGRTYEHDWTYLEGNDHD